MINEVGFFGWKAIVIWNEFHSKWLKEEKQLQKLLVE